MNPPPIRHAQGPILTTPDVNPLRPGGQGAWTRRIAGGGNRWMIGPRPRHGWISVYDPKNEFDDPHTVVSGTVISPHPSGSDVAFLHPFGNDYEYHIAPDPQFHNIVGPDMSDSLYEDATARARSTFGLDVSGVIGMETEQGLVPSAFRPREGDRVCVFGRLIVDAAHKDFHTEIHPLLVAVTARAVRGTRQESTSGGLDATVAQIISRPYLVSQEFGGNGGLFNHLLEQVKEAVVLPNPDDRIDAHPRLLPKPFAGFHSMFFDLQPPSPRSTVRDRLIIETTLTQRTEGVALTIIEHPTITDAVRVNILLRGDSYVAPPVPKRTDRVVSVAELSGESPVIWAAFGGTIMLAAGAGLPHVAALIGLGFPTNTYASPRAVSPGHAATKTRQTVTDLPGVQINRDDKQAYPVFGTIRLEWERATNGPTKKLGAKRKSANLKK